MQNVIFKFRRPSGSRQHEPSVAMTEALRRLGEAEEMQPLVAEARKSGRSVASLLRFAVLLFGLDVNLHRSPFADRLKLSAWLLV